MVKYSPDRLDTILKALSDSTRRGMLVRLSKGALTVGELASPFDMSMAAVSKHLKVLEAAEFVQKTKEGRIIRCRANLAPLAHVSELLEELGSFWRAQLDSLDNFLSNNEPTKGTLDGRDEADTNGSRKKNN